MKKILVIHTRYRSSGGEDAVVIHETDLLKQRYLVDTLIFENQHGINGMFQFLFSIWNIGSAKLVRRKIKEFQPDLVHLHNWHYGAGPLIIRTIKKKGIPLILTLHNYRLLCPSGTLLHKNKLFLSSLKQEFPWEAVRRRVYRQSRLQTFLLATVVWFHKKIKTWNMVDLYICLNDSAVSTFKNSTFGIDPKRFFIKPNFTNFTSLSNRSRRGDHFLYVGRLSEEKGIRVLVKAFQSLDTVIHIAGDGPLKEFVKNAAKTYKNIHYMGTLSKQEVQLELSQAQALIFPSICIESFGLTIIEAFSNECIVIASNLGAPSSILENEINGFLFKPGNCNDLIKKVRIVEKLSNERKDKIRKLAFESFLNKYSPDSQFEYFSSIIKRLDLTD